MLLRESLGRAREGRPRPVEVRVRVFVAVENRLLRETLARMVAKEGCMEVIGVDTDAPFQADVIIEQQCDILLMASRGSLDEDITLIRRVHLAVPKLKILLVGMARSEPEFLQCVRAGISGYLLGDASAQDVLAAVRAVQMGDAVCPGALCSALFRYFERETSELPCASVRQRMGLTRREQQLIPLIAQGLTNKEIANHFCLSEQTVKNHLYRMKHKVGAGDRLDIVQLYRTQGFLV